MAKKHWIYIKRGLSEDPKHRAAMGECIWLYMHIIDRADWETGIVYNWRDEEEAAEMSMEIRTLRSQRQKLEKLDYIRCQQKQHSQDIKIMEWINPRDYSNTVKNRRDPVTFQGDSTTVPSEFQGDIQGDIHGDIQGSSQNVTPTSYSESKSKVIKPARIYDFETMTVSQAYKVPTLKLYYEATGFMPGDILWEQVHNFITGHQLTKEQIKTAAVAWAGRGYNRRNVMGILEWAINGIPTNGNGQKQPESKPAMNEQAIQETQKMLAEKMGGNFVPRPAHIERPRIGKQS